MILRILELVNEELCMSHQTFDNNKIIQIHNFKMQSYRSYLSRFLNNQYGLAQVSNLYFQTIL